MKLGSGETVSIPLKTDGSLSKEPIALTTYPEEWPYSNDMGAKAKFPTRQNGPHVHGVTTDSGGRVFIFDLGSDATWIAERSLGKEEGKLRIVGRMERSRGDTPRHGIVSDDGLSFPSTHIDPPPSTPTHWLRLHNSSTLSRR